MKPKPRMCNCIQCKHSKKFRTQQKKLFNKTFRRLLKQKCKQWDYEMINFWNIIDYFTD